MCYFARKDFPCGDWKWGNMMERCPRQHRIGETCGAKLVHPDYIEPQETACKTCLEMAVKQRRLAKVSENIIRWAAEQDRFAASLEKAELERDQLQEKIKELHYQRPSVVFRGGGGDRNGVASIPSMATAGPNTMMTRDGGSSYTYASQPRTYSTAGQQQSAYASGGNPQSRASGTIRSDTRPSSYSVYSTHR